MNIRSLSSRLLLATVACLAAMVSLPASGWARPLETGVFDHIEFPGEERQLAFERVRAAGATTVRIGVAWSQIAPGGLTKPDGFDARNPLDPAYRFALLDQQVLAAVRQGLTPILTLFHAPEWAERRSEGFYGARNPDPKEFGHFAHAVATRYSGGVQGLPRVTRWQAWTEPNLYRYLVPQYDAPLSKPLPADANPTSPRLYRKLLAHFYRAVHGVDSKNIVVTAGLAPFRLGFPDRHAVAPLRFFRELTCMTDRNRPKPGCDARVRFDVWSTHPYTEGGPNHSAAEPENVSLGDLPELNRALRAAVRAGHVVSTRKVRLWVTEFSWDTAPPDADAVPMRLHKRWVAEALYRMWKSGVSLVTWFKIRDEAAFGADGMHYESGLWFRCDDGSACDRPKPSLKAFRFPFVAFESGKRVKVWGRTPAGVRARVLVEQRRKSGRWRTIGRLRTNRHGIFRARLRRAGKGPVRARIVRGSASSGTRGRSLPFALMETPDIPVKPFGKTN